MRAYGLNRIEADDLDVGGCSANGRATHLYSNKGRAYQSLRRGKKAKARRIHKRRARSEGRTHIILACAETEFQNFMDYAYNDDYYAYNDDDDYEYDYYDDYESYDYKTHGYDYDSFVSSSVNKHADYCI